MNDFNLLRKQDLVENPTARVPICLCLDTSTSMGAIIDPENTKDTGETFFRDGQTWNIVEGGTSRIQKLKEGIESFYNAIRNDKVAKYSAEIAIVTFADSAECVLDFANIDRQKELPDLVPDGETAMGEGVNLALDLLESRKKEYQDAGVDYYQPWLVIMSDGLPTGNPVAFNRAQKRIKELVDTRKLTVFPIGISDDADLNILNKLSPKRSALRFRNLRFEEFFEWLSQSVSRVSASTPGEEVPLPPAPASGWDQL